MEVHPLKRALLYALLFQFLAAFATSNNGPSVTTLKIKDRLRTNITQGLARNFSIDTTSAYMRYSSFVFQVHTDRINVTLTNASASCDVVRECGTTGSHIGMVQLLNYPVLQAFNFTVVYSCPDNSSDCSEVQEVLVSVVGIEVNAPVPGGCSLTSALEIEAGIYVTRDVASSRVSFQNADIGFNPIYTTQPSCSEPSTHYITRMEYRIYQTCLATPTTATMFDALESMMTPQGIITNNTVGSFQSFSYSQAKRALYYMLHGRGMVINVLAVDTLTKDISAYIPTMTYNCDHFSGQCDNSFSTIVLVVGPLLGLAGLFLCFLGHRFFHIEVIVFASLITSYLMFLLLSALTNWQDADLAIATAACTLALTLLLFGVWFITNWYYIFLILYGATMGLIITASILYSPLGYYSVIHVSYVYALILVCGMFLFMVPLVAFPSALNIVASSLVGSYAVAFGSGLFLNSFVSDILLKVVKNSSISGYIAVNNYCQLSTKDIIHASSWGLLFLISVIIQSIIDLLRRRSHRKRQNMQRKPFISDLYDGPPKVPYKAFPSVSLFVQLRRFLSRKPRAPITVMNNERRPLLSPNTITNRYNV